jgi:hypothetical protein
VWPPGGPLLVLTTGAAGEEETVETACGRSVTAMDSVRGTGLAGVTSVVEFRVESAGVGEASGSVTATGVLF